MGLGCGFQSDEMQKPAALGITLLLPAPIGLGRGLWTGRQGGGCGWSLREEGGRPFEAKRP